MAVEQSNPNWAKEIMLKMQQLQGFTSKVGWLDNEASHYDDGTPVAQVAYWDEFGTKTSPPRPFMRPAEMKYGNKWVETAAMASSKVMDGSFSGAQAMDLIGMVAQGDVLESIESVNAPPLSQITLGVRLYKQQGKKITGATIGEIARKLKEGTLDVSGVNDKPLQDSLKMIDTLTHLTESV